MWFKQIQAFQLTDAVKFNAADLENKLEQFSFTPCTPNLASSTGWISPTDEEYASLVYAANKKMLICLQIEEKLLPATVIREKLKERIKEIESTREHPVSAQEKRTLKGDVYYSLMPKAFGKIKKLFAYIDTEKNLLILNSASPKRIKEFVTFFKKTCPDINIKPPELKKLSNVMANWLQNDNAPKSLTIENACVFQDINNQSRTIRCKQQNLFAPSMQDLLKDGCEISQMSFTWNDQITFTLKDDFTLQSLTYQDTVVELADEGSPTSEESKQEKQEQFDADFIIMSEAVSELIKSLIETLTTT